MTRIKIWNYIWFHVKNFFLFNPNNFWEKITYRLIATWSGPNAVHYICTYVYYVFSYLSDWEGTDRQKHIYEIDNICHCIHSILPSFPDPDNIAAVWSYIKYRSRWCNRHCQRCFLGTQIVNTEEVVAVDSRKNRDVAALDQNNDHDNGM